MNQQGKLTREKIICLALKLLDAEGRDAFSMRRLASKLNVDPMAIYYYFSNKSELMHAVINTMMEDCKIPEPGANWQEDVKNLCRGFRQVAKLHPGAFCVYETYEKWLPAEHRLHEVLHATLLKAGFSRESTASAARVLLAYTEVVAVDEVSGWLGPEDRDILIKSLNNGPYPTLLKLVDEITSVDPDSEFEFGLNVIVGGLEKIIE